MNDNIELFKEILNEIIQEFGQKVTEDDNYFSFADNIKDKIANYKENLDILDDCIFVDVLDELTTYNVDLKQFDELLNKEELTESEETYISYLIDFTNSLIRQHIRNKIEDLNNLINRF